MPVTASPQPRPPSSPSRRPPHESVCSPRHRHAERLLPPRRLAAEPRTAAGRRRGRRTAHRRRHRTHQAGGGSGDLHAARLPAGPRRRGRQPVADGPAASPRSTASRPGSWDGAVVDDLGWTDRPDRRQGPLRRIPVDLAGPAAARSRRRAPGRVLAWSRTSASSRPCGRRSCATTGSPCWRTAARRRPPGCTISASRSWAHVGSPRSRRSPTSTRWATPQGGVAA